MVEATHDIVGAHGTRVYCNSGIQAGTRREVERRVGWSYGMSLVECIHVSTGTGDSGRVLRISKRLGRWQRGFN